MNFTRLLGLNDKIYKKFGEYCISEMDNECFIVCSGCQEEHQSEETFWQHIREVHNYSVPPTLMMSQQQESQLTENDLDGKSCKIEIEDMPMYEEADSFEQLSDNKESNDILNDLSPYMVTDEAKLLEPDPKKKCEKSNQRAVLVENPHKRPNSPAKYVDIERIASKTLLNEKVLQKILLQQQQTNIQFKYKLNRLAQTVKVLERDIRDENSTNRKKFMKIVPDTPLTTRDEVLILDGELHRSKEMRKNLQEEALMVVTESPDVYCRVLWRFIMTDEVSNQFCWRGVIDGERVIKYPIKDMAMLDIFQSAFREKFPAQPPNTFKEKTIIYFNKANERIKRSKLERAKFTKYDDASDDNSEEAFC